jgi:hypothetical protein
MTDFYNQTYLKNFERVSISSPKKKKRKHSGDNQLNDSSSINIVDRVLEFSKYKSNTVLYVLCRDWINATTSLNSSSRYNKQSKNEYNEENLDQNINNKSNYFINSLPSPIDIKLENVDKDKSISYNFDLNDIKEDDKILLMKKNLERWKNIRKEKIKNHHIENERYKESHDILKNIYETL